MSQDLSVVPKDFSIAIRCLSISRKDLSVFLGLHLRSRQSVFPFPTLNSVKGSQLFQRVFQSRSSLSSPSPQDGRGDPETAETDQINANTPILSEGARVTGALSVKRDGNIWPGTKYEDLELFPTIFFGLLVL